MWLETFNEMRKKSGMSLDEISAKSGVPKGTLAKITSGITKAPTLETMKSLVYAMGYTLKDLDDGLDGSDNFSVEEKAHIKKYRLLDPYGKEAVDGVLDVEYRRCRQNQAARDAALFRGGREETEAAEIFPELKIPTPVSEGGLQNTDSCLMSFVGSMDPGQQQNYYNQMHKMLGQQKESSTAAAPLVADDKSPEYEPPDQSQ